MYFFDLKSNIVLICKTIDYGFLIRELSIFFVYLYIKNASYIGFWMRSIIGREIEI